MFSDKRRYSGKALVGNLFCCCSQAPYRLVEIQAVEQADGVHHQSQSAELILLALPVVFTHLSALAVEYLPGKLVAVYPHE